MAVVVQRLERTVVVRKTRVQFSPSASTLSLDSVNDWNSRRDFNYCNLGKLQFQKTQSLLDSPSASIFKTRGKTK